MQSYKLIIHNLSKSYQGRMILENLNLELHSGETYCLMGASGSGKTTFLRILLGLAQSDGGTVTVQAESEPDGSMVAVFQEDRLCESFSALENVMLAVKKTCRKEQVYQELCQLLPEESVLRPVSTLSGGMKRRVAIVRALLAPSCAVLMDEPFTGLDEDTRQHVITYIKEKTDGKLVIVVTHQEEDIAALGGRLLTLQTHIPTLHS